MLERTTQPATDQPEYLTRPQAAELMTELGFPMSEPTLKRWGRRWREGDRHGPTPLFLSPRRLRYERREVIAVTRELIEAARRAATGAEE